MNTEISSTNKVLKEVYEKSGMNIVDFATKGNTEPSRISLWLRNKEIIKFTTLEKLLLNFDIKISICIEW